MADFYKDQEFINDNLCIYRRPGSKGGRWQYRAFVGGKYHVKSAKTADRRKARDVAEQAYKDLVRRQRAGQTLDRVLFRQQAEKWIAALEDEKNQRKKTAIISPLNLYLKPFFGEMDVREIGEDQVDDYKDWRRTECSPAPSISTVNTELWVLRTFFKRLPKSIMKSSERPNVKNVSFKKPPEGFKEQVDREPFTEDEIADIRRELSDRDSRAAVRATTRMYDQWQKDCEKGKGVPRDMLGTMVAQLRCRNGTFLRPLILMHYVDMCIGTGARPSTLARMKIKNVKIRREDGRLFLGAETRKGGKTRRVQMIPTDIGSKGIHGMLWINKHRGTTHPNTPLIPWTTHHLNKLFCKVLEEMDIRNDEFDQPRSIYSLRHTYINHRLLNRTPVSVVAANTLTSVQMIDRYYKDIETLLNDESLRVEEDDKLFYDDDIVEYLDEMDRQFVDDTGMTPDEFDQLPDDQQRAIIGWTTE